MSKSRKDTIRRQSSTEVSSSLLAPPSSQQAFILDQLREFFSSNPPLLAPAPEGGHTDSSGTRRPGVFDRHLHTLYRLKRVVKLPSIASDFIDIAQKCLDSYPGDLPPISKRFPTTKNRRLAQRYSAIGKIRAEDDVQRVYEVTTAEACSTVAGTLAFQLPEWSVGCLRWTLGEIAHQKQDGFKKNQAVADGFLNVVTVDNRGNRLELSELHEEMIRRFPVIAAWEFKNLNFSVEPQTMGSVVNDYLDSWFPWEGCEFGAKCSTTHDIGATGARMGYDALNSISTSVAEAREAKSQNDHGPMPEFFDLKAYNDKHPHKTNKEKDTPRHILQQAWSQAVRHDATIVVIQAGNREIICIRDRENQTFFVSDVIDVSSRDYRKLHTGIFIAAVRDAEDRTKQLMDVTPATWDMEFGIDPAKRLDLKAVPKKAIPEILRQQACVRNWLKIVPDPLNMPYHPFTRDLYKRVTLCGSSQAPFNQDFDTYFRLFAKPSFYGHRINRVTLDVPGALFVRGVVDPTFVLKNACTPEHVRRLEDEYRVYVKLHDAGVTNIPKVVGFFRWVNESDATQCFAALVLEDMGQSLEKVLKEAGGEPFKPTRQQINLFVKTLWLIHQANFLHGNITSKSLMFRTGGNPPDIAIIGFADTKPLPHPTISIAPDDAIELGIHSSPAPTLCEFLVRREMRDLFKLLSNPLKRSADAGPDAPTIRPAAISDVPKGAEPVRTVKHRRRRRT